MKHYRALIIIGSIVFFLSALTFYLNRVIFPQLIKKIAIQRVEEATKRKVEIGSIHFNWVKGFIIDKVKIYEKDSDAVFAQADQVSFGVLVFPGLKHWRITIPFINVRSPSAHLVRTAADVWNFSDMYTPPVQAAPAASKQNKPAFEIAWGGISVNDGKFLVEDTSTSPAWSEYFDNINLKLSLSYKGISYNFTTDIPKKNGFIGATVYYQPLTKNTEAHIHLKNIDTASYLSLISIPDVHLDSGLIEEIDLNINYTQEKTAVQGDVRMKNINVTGNDQNFKGDIDLRGLDASYENGDITARGQMTLSNVQTSVPGLSAGGTVEAKVNDFTFTKQEASFNGSLHGAGIFVNLNDRRVRLDDVTLDNIKVMQDQNGIASSGSMTTKGLFVQWPPGHQEFRGDVALKNVLLRMKDENDINIDADVQADDFSTNLNDKNVSGKRLLLNGARLQLTNQKNVELNTGLSLDGLTLLAPGFLGSASVATDKFIFGLEDNVVKVNTTLTTSKGKVVLDGHKIITADPQLELNVQLPLDDPKRALYKGSITLSDGTVQGFAPLQPLNNIGLDMDFQNDDATINALSVDILDTNVRVNGTVKDFKDPVLNITAEANELNLSKIKDFVPQLVKPYGLDFNGISDVKIRFEGRASRPFKAKLLAVASVKDAGASSSKFHQQVKNITGIVEATPNSVKWHDFTAVYQGQKYSLSGSLDHFKDPQMFLSLDGPGVQIKADLGKAGDLVTLKSLTGNFRDITFESKGDIHLLPEGPVFDIHSTASLLVENILKDLPADQQKILIALNPTAMVSITADTRGTGTDWKNYQTWATISSPVVTLMGYKMTDMKIDITQEEGKIKNLTFDGKLYSGTVHAVGSLDLLSMHMPYDLALNIDNTDMHQLKMDSPLKMEEIDGKFFLTTVARGTIDDFKNALHATGSMAIRDGFLAQFNLFKGLLGILNDAMSLGQVEITDVEGNFTIDHQKINTDNLRLKGPTIVLLSKGWVNFDQDCDLNVSVDLSSGVVPAIAHDVLSSLNIRIYDKIQNPKFKKKISMPQVINTLIKNFLQ